LIAWATEIKVRAERRAGELLRETQTTGPGPGRGKKNQSSPNDRFSLKQHGARGVGKKVASSDDDSTPTLKTKNLIGSKSGTMNFSPQSGE